MIKYSAFLVALILLTARLGLAQEDDAELDDAEPDDTAEEEIGFRGLGGRGYIGIDTQLFSTSTAKITTVTTSPTGFPTTSQVDYTTTQVGLASPSWGFGFGYAVGDYVSLGARLMFESATVSVGNAESKATGIGFAPNVKVLMSANQDIVPYASVTFGYRKLTTEGSAASTVNEIDGVMYGGGVGLYLLPNPNASFEPSFSLLWNSVKDEFSSESVTALGFYMGLSLSAWFGDDEPGHRHTPEPTSEPTSQDRSQVVEPTTGKLTAYLRTVDHELQVRIDPSEEVPQFLFTLLTPATDTSGCDTLHLSGTEGSVSIPTEVDQSLDRRRQVLTANVPYQAITVGVSKGRSQMEFCNTQWKLTAAERRKLLNLIALFRTRARREGTFQAAAAVPAPLTNASTGSAPTSEVTPED